MTKEEFDAMGITDRDLVSVMYCGFQSAIRLCPENILMQISNKNHNKNTTTTGFFLYCFLFDSEYDKEDNTIKINECWCFLPYVKVEKIEIIKKDFWV